MPNNSAQPNTNKLLGLEIVRFISALAVLVWHYQHFYYVADKPTNFVRDQQPFYSFLKIFYNYGYWGVEVFWCISGYIFFWKYGEAISNKIIKGKKFFILRFSRLYPLHLITLLFVMLLQQAYFLLNNYFFVYQNNDFSHFALQLFMASNWVHHLEYSFNGPIWSISIEVLVYFIFFVTLRFISKSALINIFVIVLWAASKKANITHPIFDCLAFFYVGGLAAIVRQSIENTKQRFILKAIAWGVVCFMPLPIWAFKLYEAKYFNYLFLICYTPMILFCISENISVNAITKKVIEAMGNMTYSSYLIHFPIQITIAIYFSITKTAIPQYDSTLFVVFITSTLIAAYFIYRYFEVPAQDIIRRNLL